MLAIAANTLRGAPFFFAPFHLILGQRKVAVCLSTLHSFSRTAPRCKFSLLSQRLLIYFLESWLLCLLVWNARDLLRILCPGESLPLISGTKGHSRISSLRRKCPFLGSNLGLKASKPRLRGSVNVRGGGGGEGSLSERNAPFLRSNLPPPYVSRVSLSVRIPIEGWLRLTGERDPLLSLGATSSRTH